MTEVNKNTKKICSFYASDWHLVTMLLPNIDKKINEGEKVTTILENNINVEMETLLERVQLKEKEKIMKIGWKKFEENNKELENKIRENDYIIIVGKMNYIEKMNEIINKINQETDKNITILNCYDIEEVKIEVKDIINQHEKILNTLGEKDKEEYIIKVAK